MSQPGDSMFGVTPAGGARIDLDTDLIETVDVLGAGIPDVYHTAVRTPGRDGETIVRSVLEPRYLITRHEVSGLNAAHVRHLRQVLIGLANPKLGSATIDFTPPGTDETYLIDGRYAGGLEFSRSSPTWGQLSEAPIFISWRCPDPAWRLADDSTVAITAGGVGLSIPMSIPMSIADTGQTAVITNGNAAGLYLASYPVITVTGTHTGVKVSNSTSGKHVWFPALAVTTETLVVDMARRTAALDGVNVMPYRSADSEAWALEPGDNTVEVLVSTGTAEVSLTYATRLIGV